MTDLELGAAMPWDREDQKSWLMGSRALYGARGKEDSPQDADQKCCPALWGHKITQGEGKSRNGLPLGLRKISFSRKERKETAEVPKGKNKSSKGGEKSGKAKAEKSFLDGQR